MEAAKRGHLNQMLFFFRTADDPLNDPRTTTERPREMTGTEYNYYDKKFPQSKHYPKKLVWRTPKKTVCSVFWCSCSSLGCIDHILLSFARFGRPWHLIAEAVFLAASIEWFSFRHRWGAWGCGCQITGASDGAEKKTAPLLCYEKLQSSKQP